MKIKFLSIALMSTLFFAACSGESKEPAAEPEAPAADAAPATLAVAAATYTVDAATSSIAWKGEVAGVYGHEGTLAVASGTLDTDGSTVTGGVIEIDMTSLKANVDESFPQGKADKLQGHLGSADFFNTSEFATATFKITSANGNTITGDLTVIGKTNEETFNVTSQEISEGSVKVNGTLTFDRQKYGISWNDMKDKILSDDIALTISVVANK